MTKQRLAKLPDIQTACLAHNAGWSMQVIHNQQHQPINVEELYLYNITGNYLINGGFKVTKEDEFYLHPKHNEELEPKAGDILAIVEHSGSSVNDFLEVYRPLSHHRKVAGVFMQAATDIGVKFIPISEMNEQFYIMHRPSVPYFPQFEWVEV